MKFFNPFSKRVLSAALGTLAAAAAVHLAGTDHILMPGVIMILSVVLWSRREGVTGGMVSALVGMLCLALAPAFQPPAGSGHLLLWAISLPLAALLAGTVSRRAGKAPETGGSGTGISEGQGSNSCLPIITRFRCQSQGGFITPTWDPQGKRNKSYAKGQLRIHKAIFPIFGGEFLREFGRKSTVALKFAKELQKQQTSPFRE